MRARVSRGSRGISRRLSRSRSRDWNSSFAIAPLQTAHAVEGVVFQPLDHVGVERLRRSRDAECAIVHVAAGAAGDLAKLARRQIAVVLAVEFADGRERDVVDVEIEPHADGVGGHQKFDVARLIERHLRVARARRQRAEHHGRAAALAADQLGDGVDLVGREGDDGGARRKPRDLLLAGVGQLRQPRPRDEIGAGNEIRNRVAHGLRAEQKRLGAAARMQQAIGEDVAALGIAGKLDLVDGEKIDIDLARHRLDGRHPVARPLRLDFFLAGDERHFVGADAGRDLVVDLTRQKPQRQSDHAAFVPEHALDGEVRLAGVGRPENCSDIANARF